MTQRDARADTIRTGCVFCGARPQRHRRANTRLLTAVAGCCAACWANGSGWARYVAPALTH